MILSGPKMRLASATAMSPWPTWTPSAPDSRTASTSSSMIRGTPYASQTGFSLLAAATSSPWDACFSRSCRMVTPPARAACTASSRVSPPFSQDRSVTA